MISDEGELPPSYPAEINCLLSTIETAVDTTVAHEAEQ